MFRTGADQMGLGRSKRHWGNERCQLTTTCTQSQIANAAGDLLSGCTLAIAAAVGALAYTLSRNLESIRLMTGEHYGPSRGRISETSTGTAFIRTTWRTSSPSAAIIRSGKIIDTASGMGMVRGITLLAIFR